MHKGESHENVRFQFTCRYGNIDGGHLGVRVGLVDGNELGPEPEADDGDPDLVLGRHGRVPWWSEW